MHRLAMLLVEACATKMEVAASLFGSASFRSKWGSDLKRLWAEVSSAFAKKR